MKDNVTLIPVRKKAGSRVKTKEDKPKLRVAAYCRVSTDSDEQAGSYEIQVAHYTDYISRNPEWELAGIYADDGISGTNTKKRERFNEMIDDCEAGKIDKVITKSISRFARNTLDCLKYVRKLKELNIDIFFEKENIHTLEASGELLLTIMASLAQQESQTLSQNVKLGLQFRYQDGKVQVNHNHFLGYTKDADGNLIIDEEEAKVVRRIFREYLEGSSFRDIAEGLERDGIKTGAKKNKWHLSTIQGILRNEKYIGDALLQKTITTDFIEKTRIKNDGLLPQYYVKDSHPAIIPKDIFTQVQEEMVRRANMFSGENGSKRRVYSSKYALSSICTCSRCGDIYRRIAWNNRGKHKKINWNTNKQLLFKIMCQIRNQDVKTIGITLTAYLERMNENLDAIKDFELNQFTGRYMLHMLARLTDFVYQEMGYASNFSTYVDRNPKTSYDIEHILPDAYDDYAQLFNDEEDFKRNRQKFGKWME